MEFRREAAWRDPISEPTLAEQHFLVLASFIKSNKPYRLIRD